MTESSNFQAVGFVKIIIPRVRQPFAAVNWTPESRSLAVMTRRIGIKMVIADAAHGQTCAPCSNSRGKPTTLSSFRACYVCQRRIFRSLQIRLQICGNTSKYERNRIHSMPSYCMAFNKWAAAILV